MSHLPARTSLTRCEWCGSDLLYLDYHDNEWGVPVRDDRRLFEMLTLEGAQAGLSWITILRKRENYRLAFDNFDTEIIARYDQRKVSALLGNPGIVRNRLKIASTINNARAVLRLNESGSSFSNFIWQFVGGTPRQNAWASMKEIPALTPESDRMSRELKRLGFRFVGSTVCYALMQAVGMVNDHVVGCYRHREIRGLR